jgi:hypothetical protein
MNKILSGIYYPDAQTSEQLTAQSYSCKPVAGGWHLQELPIFDFKSANPSC